jgi:hypothetical protein
MNRDARLICKRNCRHVHKTPKPCFTLRRKLMEEASAK